MKAKFKNKMKIKRIKNKIKIKKIVNTLMRGSRIQIRFSIYILLIFCGPVAKQIKTGLYQTHLYIIFFVNLTNFL